MTDDVVITVDSRAYCDIEALHIDADIYTAASSFEATVRNGNSIVAGGRIFIQINGNVAFNGIVDRINKSGNKDANTVSVSGRDVMGLIIDTHITSFRTIKNKTLRQVTEYYLKDIDFARHLSVIYLDGAEALDIPQEFIQPQPGQTVFDLLSGIAVARGIYFYMLPNGSLVFGRPRGYGSSPFALWHTGEGSSNTLNYNFTDDISQRYSSVSVYAQDEYDKEAGVTSYNKKATAVDNQFPAFSKPLVIESQTAGVSPASQARMLIEQQRFNGWRLEYTVAEFSQRGRVWQPDTVCAVDDVRIPFTGECVIYGRSFDLKKEHGGATAKTTLTLSRMGVA